MLPVKNVLAPSFHGYYDNRVRPYQSYQQNSGWSYANLYRHTTIEDRNLSYRFYLHAHPYVAELVNRLIQGSVPGLQDADTTYCQNPDGTLQSLKDDFGNTKSLSDGTPIPRPVLYQELFTGNSYGPSNLVNHPYPVKDLDFSSSGAYSVYNWELFYHIPLTIAIHLSQNQRYEEAQQWFKYILDLTDD